MNELKNRDETEALFREPAAVLVKHSTRCPISRAAFEQIDVLTRQRPDTPIYVVDVKAHADVSDYLAERLGVRHDSPQAFVMVDGEPVWHASHLNITARALAHGLAEAAR